MAQPLATNDNHDISVSGDTGQGSASLVFFDAASQALQGLQRGLEEQARTHAAFAAQLAELARQIKQGNRDKEEVEQVIAALMEQWQQAENDLRQAENDLRQMQERAQEQAKQGEREQRERNQRGLAQTAENERLAQQGDALRGARHDIQQNIISLQATVRTLEGRILEGEELLARKNAELTLLASVQEGWRSQILAEVRQLKQERGEAQEGASEAVRQHLEKMLLLAETLGKADAAQAHLSNLLAEQRRQEAANASLADDNSTLREVNEGLAAQNSGLTEEVRRRARLNRLLRQSQEKKEAELAVTQQNQANTKAGFEQWRASAGGKYASLQQQIAVAQAEADVAWGELAQLLKAGEQERANQQKELERHQARLGRVEQNVLAGLQLICEAGAWLKEINRELEEKQAELEEKQRGVEGARGETGQLSMSANELRLGVKKLEEQRDALTASMAEDLRVFSALFQEAEQRLQQREEELTERLNTRARELDEREGRVKAWEQDVNARDLELTGREVGDIDKQQERERLETELAQLQEAREALKQANEELRRQIEQKKKDEGQDHTQLMTQHQVLTLKYESDRDANLREGEVPPTEEMTRRHFNCLVPMGLARCLAALSPQQAITYGAATATAVTKAVNGSLLEKKDRTWVQFGSDTYNSAFAYDTGLSLLAGALLGLGARDYAGHHLSKANQLAVLEKKNAAMENQHRLSQEYTRDVRRLLEPKPQVLADTVDGGKQPAAGAGMAMGGNSIDPDGGV